MRKSLAISADCLHRPTLKCRDPRLQALSTEIDGRSLRGRGVERVEIGTSTSRITEPKPEPEVGAPALMYAC